MADWALIVGAIGAITGIASLIWHMLNSRSKVVIDRLQFQRVRNHDFKDREVIHILVVLRNKSNRSTTIEDAGVEIGSQIIGVTSYLQPTNMDANSSKKFDFRLKLDSGMFEKILEEKPVRLGMTIVHTFGILKKHGFTDFSSDLLSL